MGWWANRQKGNVDSDPFSEKELDKNHLEDTIVRKIREADTTVLPRVSDDLRRDRTREMAYLNQLGALDDISKRLRYQKREPFSKWLTPKVRVAWFDRDFSVLHIRQMPWMADGMIADPWWGRAADVLGPNARPITISVDGKTSAGFVVDGDKGVGINIERKDNNGAGAYAKLGTTSELCWAVLDTKKLADQFGSMVTQRTLWIVGILATLMGALIGHSIK